jgi:hypothetical protein
MKIDLRMKLLSPLAHFGDERMGTMQAARTMKFEYEGEFIDVPVFSGNASQRKTMLLNGAGKRSKNCFSHL